MMGFGGYVIKQGYDQFGFSCGLCSYCKNQYMFVFIIYRCVQWYLVGMYCVCIVQDLYIYKVRVRLFVVVEIVL